MVRRLTRSGSAQGSAGAGAGGAGGGSAGAGGAAEGGAGAGRGRNRPAKGGWRLGRHLRGGQENERGIPRRKEPEARHERLQTIRRARPVGHHGMEPGDHDRSDARRVLSLRPATSERLFRG